MGTHPRDVLRALASQPSRNIVCVTDAQVHRRVWPALARTMAKQPAWRDPIVLPVGEAAKSMRCLQGLHRAFLRRGLDRSGVVVAVGGGVVSDVAGFAAATWMRGVRWVVVPTTLLSMVDAAIGGKVAINLGRTKNLVGAFHQPEAVFAATALLRTLPERERRSGLGEVAKVGMIADARLFRLLEQTGRGALRAHAGRDAEIVHRCARVKTRIVSADEKESGQRAVLNFGHTVGHVLEARRRSRLAHGEAVGLGMLVACRLAELTGLSDSEPRQRLTRLLHAWSMPTCAASHLPWRRIWSSLARDKKSLHGMPRFVLTPRIGAAVTGCAIEPETLRQALRVLDPAAGVR